MKQTNNDGVSLMNSFKVYATANGFSVRINAYENESAMKLSFLSPKRRLNNYNYFLQRNPKLEKHLN